MPNLIYFFHPGQQKKITNNQNVIHNIAGYRYDDYGIRKHNTIPDNHWRKFLISKGYFINNYDTINLQNNVNIEPNNDKFTFWGEWEAESYYKFINNAYSGQNRPAAIHYPIFISNPIHPNNGQGFCHSTDPWVFHNPIFLTHCHMPHYPMLRNLNHNDILILGSVSNGYFVIDTIFVIDDIININNIDDINNATLSNNVPIFSFIDPAIFIDTNYRHYLGGHNNVFYKGKVYDKNNPTMFSFFPCSSEKRLFSRPNHHQRAMGMGVAGAGNYTNNQILQVWLDLVNLVQNNDLQLGLYANEPNSFPDFQSAENAFNPNIFR